MTSSAFRGDPRIAPHHAKLRNGAEAVKLAAQANELTGGKDATVLDALGAAYAEAGEFAEAWPAQQALEPMIGARIRLYRENRASRN